MEDIMESTVTEDEADTRWMQCVRQLIDSDVIPDSIGCGTNRDGTLDYRPVPFAMKNIWLFNNGGERNEVY